ncbi:MAG TPA: cytochrome c [Terracidiphilus sp.]|jgi:cytochrome c5
MLKSFLLFMTVVLIVIASASAPARPAQESGQGITAKKMNAEALTKAKRVYNMDCALCHGATGDGKSDLAKDMQMTMLDWTDSKSLAGQSDQQLFDVIRKGKGKMPPEDDSRAKNDEVKDVVQYIRTFAKEGAAAPATPAAQPQATPPAQTTAPSTSPSN